MTQINLAQSSGITIQALTVNAYNPSVQISGTAMLIMASTCEERLNAYMEGYDKGYNIGFTQGQTFKKSENKETSCGFD